MRTWILCLVLFGTALGGLVNAKANDPDYWRNRRYERQHHRWQEREARRNYWRHHHHHDDSVQIRLP